jgi:hypothetical protein
MNKRTWCTAVMVLVSAATLSAQTPTSLPLVLRLPASTRHLGLGDAAVAGVDDDVIFYNPAQLTLVRGSTVSGQRYAPGNTTAAFSTALAFFGGGLGVGAQWLGFSTRALTFPISAAALDTSGILTASSAALTLAYGRAIKGVRIGLASKVAQESAPMTRSTSGFVDLGIEKDYRAFGIGLAVQNISTFGVAHTLEPSRVTLGVMTGAALINILPVSPFLDAALAAQVSVLNDGWVKPAGGLEFGVNWIQGYSLTVRGGARRPEIGERPLTAGATLAADRFRFDYALETREGDNLSHRIGVRIR